MRRAADLALGCAAVLVSLVLLEGACQLFARLVIFPRWDRDMAKPNFLLARSPDAVLAYELAPRYAIETDHLWAVGNERMAEVIEALLVAG